MKRAINFLLLGMFISLCNIEAQILPDIGGEISRTQSFDLDKSQGIWTRTRFRLKLDHKGSDIVRAHVNLKTYTVDDPRFDFKLSEAYIDQYWDRFDLRIGVQRISWGTAYRINPTDNINPYDHSEQAAFIPEERLGVSAIKFDYYPITNLTFTGVLIPYFVPALEEPDVALPEKTLDNSEHALKLTAQSIFGCDFSVSYFNGKDDYPWKNKKYRDVEIYGGDVIGTIGEVALWAEGAYTNPSLGDSYFQIAAGGEYTLGDDLYIMGQVYHRNYPDTKENYLMYVLRYPFRDIHTLQFGMAYEPDNEIYIVYPEVNLSLADAVSLVLSCAYVEGDIEGTFMSQMKDRFFITCEYSF